MKKEHERPSIGVLLCADKDDEVVEYALARTTSPALVAEYQTVLPPKAVLQRKLHELYAQLAPDDDNGNKARENTAWDVGAMRTSDTRWSRWPTWATTAAAAAAA